MQENCGTKLDILQGVTLPLLPNQADQQDLQSAIPDKLDRNPAKCPRRRATMSSPQNKLMYSKPEAAELLSISLRKLDDLIAMKELSVRRVGRRVLVTYEALLQFTKHDHN